MNVSKGNVKKRKSSKNLEEVAKDSSSDEDDLKTQAKTKTKRGKFLNQKAGRTLKIIIG